MALYLCKMSVDFGYFAVSALITVVLFAVVFSYEYIKFRRWVKYMDSVEEAKPYTLTEPKRTKTQMQRYNRVMRNVERELKAKYIANTK